MIDENMKIENAKWHTDLQGNNIAIHCTLNGQPSVFIPINEDNSHYIKLKKMIDAGDVIVADADPIVT